jgi:hypothetical protein
MSKSIQRGRPVPAVSDTRALLDRIIDAPQVVQRLQPDVLHRVIERCGLEDCSQLVALATAEQLKAVFDLDLWRATRPGTDEQFDAARFGVWLEVLVDAGEEVAGQKLAGMDPDLVAAALAQHLRAFDLAATPASGSSDDATGQTAQIGGYTLVARRTGSWDAIVSALIALDAGHSTAFHAVMRRSVALSNEGFEPDGLHSLLSDRKQVMFDLALDRERRREQQGFATPAQARAFLQAARELPRGPGSHPPADPVARAYFRTLEWSPGHADGWSSAAASGLLTSPEPPDAPDQSVDALNAIVEVLGEAGLLPQLPRALLQDPEGSTPHLRRMQMLMEFAREHDPAAFEARGRELAYLANALVAGCSIQGRTFTNQEGSDGAVAICNLGLENWPRHWVESGPVSVHAGNETDVTLPDSFLVEHDLVSVFQVGWSVLYDEVCMAVAGRLVQMLPHLKPQAPDTQAGLKALRVAMKRHWQAGAPWLARDALDVVAILDMPAWATLLGLIDECPTLHAALGASQRGARQAVSATAFEFISDNSQIASVRSFTNALPELLDG